MQIVRHKPVARGVTELMYVGDDEADKIAIAKPTVGVADAVAGAIGLYLALTKSTTGIRLAGAGICTAVAYRWYKYH